MAPWAAPTANPRPATHASRSQRRSASQRTASATRTAAETNRVVWLVSIDGTHTAHRTASRPGDHAASSRAASHTSSRATKASAVYCLRSPLASSAGASAAAVPAASAWGRPSRLPSR